MKKSDKEALKQLEEYYGWQVLRSIVDKMIERVSNIILEQPLSEKEYRVFQNNLQFMKSFRDIKGILEEAKTLEVVDDPYE